MATRRDQLQSYQFLTQRVVSAFVMRETDPAQSPLRRGIGAVFAGLMIAVVVAAGFGIYGLLTKIGSGDWKVDGTVVVEKESGAAYVYKGGALYPTVNITSAILAAQQPTPHIVKAPANSLTGVPRGPRIGIVGAPDSLPYQNSTVGAPWTLCSLIPNGGRRQTLLIVGGGPAGGQRLTGGRQGQGLLVTGPNGAALVWNGRRYAIPDPADRQALFGPTEPANVGAAWINGLIPGAAITTPKVPNPGADSPIPGHPAGDVVYVVTGSQRQYYLVFPDGVATLTSLQRDLLAGQPGYNEAEIPRPLANEHPSGQQLQPSDRDLAPPDTLPTLVQPVATTDPLCIQSGDAHAFPTVSVGGTVTDSQFGTKTTSQSAQGASLADLVSVPAGRVAVVQSLARPTSTSGTLYLVTDTGIRYVVPSVDVLKILGFQPDQVVDMPEDLIAELPRGPTLDVADARQAVNVSTVEGN